MGLTEIQKEMIRGIAANNMLKARQGALGVLNEDTTQKNKNFVARYKSILTSEHGFLYELPAELKGLLQCEDVSMSFKESRYYVSEQQKELASKIFRMAEVSQKLMELQIPYKNATLLYGPPGTGKTMFAKYIAFKKALPFCYLNFSRIIDSYMGSTAKNIAKAFAYASSNPCIFMLDEVDTISCNRKLTSGKGSDGEMSRITVTLMQEFDKIPNDVIVLAATNRYDLLDSAFVSRFSIKQEMKPFTTEENQKMIQMFLSDIGYEFDETEINRIVKGTHDQREIMNRTIQILAEKIAKEE